jgi:putative ABC transport system ATP-binding protein
VTVYAMEVDRIGEFVGKAISVPAVDAGIFLALIAYMLFSEPWLAGVALAFFVPQAVLVAWFQRKVNLEVGERIKILRQINEEALGLLDGRKGFSFSFVAVATRASDRLRIRFHHLEYLLKYLVLLLIQAARISVLVVGGYTW